MLKANSNIALFPQRKPIPEKAQNTKQTDGNLALDLDFFPLDEQDPLITCDYTDFMPGQSKTMHVFEGHQDQLKNRKFSLKNIDITDVVILVGIFCLGLMI